MSRISHISFARPSIITWQGLRRQQDLQLCCHCWIGHKLVNFSRFFIICLTCLERVVNRSATLFRDSLAEVSKKNKLNSAHSLDTSVSDTSFLSNISDLLATSATSNTAFFIRSFHMHTYSYKLLYKSTFNTRIIEW